MSTDIPGIKAGLGELVKWAGKYEARPATHVDDPVVLLTRSEVVTLTRGLATCAGLLLLLLREAEAAVEAEARGDE